MNSTPHAAQSAQDHPTGKGYIKWYLPIPVLWIMLFSPQLILRQCFFWYDHAMTNYPFKMFFAHAWKRWRFPLWAHEYLCGYPLFASSEAAAAYPLSWLTALLPAPHGYSWFVCLHVLGAATGVFLFLRHLKLEPPSILLGAIVYGFSGCIWSRMHQVTVVTGYCWLPFVALTAVLLAERFSLRRLFLLAVTSAALILGSHPQISLYVLILAGVVGLSWHDIELRGIQRRIRVSVVISLAMLLALGLAAVQLVPFFELLQHTERASALHEGYFLFGSLPPSRLITLLMPNYFGSPANASFWGHMEPGMFGEYCGYVGILPLLLALAGVTSSRRKEIRLFGAVLLISLLFALGEFFPLYRFLRFLPVFGSTRIPARFLMPAAFALSVLSAFGLNVLCNRIREDSARTVSWTLLYGSALLTALGIFVAVIRPELFRLGQYGQFLTGLPAESHAYPRIQAAMSPMLGSGLIHFALITLSCLAFGWVIRTGKVQSVYIMALLIVAVDLAAFNVPMNAHAPRDTLLSEPKVARVIKEQGDGRLYVVTELGVSSGTYRHPTSTGWYGKGSEYIGCTEMLDGNLPLLYRLHCINGMTTLMLADYKGVLSATDVYGARIRFPVAPDSPLLDALGVHYLLSQQPLQREGYQLVADLGDGLLYRNPWALPQAFLVDVWTSHDKPQSFHETLSQQAYKSIPEVHLLGVPDPIASEQDRFGFQPVTRLEYGTNRVEVHWNGGIDALLVMLDKHYPGWKARINGREERIWQVNGAFRAVRVKPSDNSLVLTFEPFSVRLGTFITAVSLLVVIVLWVLGSRGRALEQPPSFDAECGKPLSKWTLASLVLGAVVLCIAPAPGKWRDDFRQAPFRRYVSQQYSDLGAEFARNGKLQDAERIWRDALSIDPNCETALKNLELLADIAHTEPGGHTGK